MKKLFGRNRQYEEDMDLEGLDTSYEETEEYYEEGAYDGEEPFEGEFYEEEGFYESEEGVEAFETEAVYEGEEEVFEAEAIYEGEEEAFEAEAVYEGEEEVFEAEAVYEGEEEAFEAEAVYEGEEEAFEAEAVYEGEEEVFEAETVYEGEEFYEEADAGEEVYFEGAPEEADYIELEDLSEDGEVYFEEDESACEENEEEAILAWSDMPDKNIFQKIWYSMIHMSTMDRLITTTGVLVLILALVAGGVFASARMSDTEVASFDMVGAQLDGITLIGEHGLTAVADAELAKIQAANAIENEDGEEGSQGGEYQENDYKREVEVTLNMTSIEKDLKLKFVNSSTKKLIANVPFSVTVKTPDGKTETWTDDDMDGIIYKSDITPGSYSVAMNALTDSKYAGYIISTESKKVTVRKEIAYEKVDVSDEIKNESELAQKEDAENELEVESELVDTVAWVESTVTPGKVVWTEVPRASLNVDTSLFAQGGPIMKTAAEASVGVLLGQAEQLAANMPDGGISTITADEISPNSSAAPETSASPETSPSTSPENPTPSPSTSPENPTPSPSTSPENPTPSHSPEEPDQGTVTELTLHETSLSLVVGQEKTLEVTVKPETEKDKLNWTSDKPSVATVENGKVTAVAAGTAEITVKAGDMTAKCTVTVTDANVSITIDPASTSVLSGESKDLTITITGGSASGQATIKTSDKNIATLSTETLAADGKTTVKVTGVGAGTATITVTYKVGNVEKSATATVKVLSKDNKLVDKNNNQIWVKAAEDKYVEATYADYYNTAITTFYLRTEAAPRYTGWQSIDGKMYYFDANGNKVTGEQVIQGAKYTFASDGSLVVGSGSFGIDVSKWNGKIDWNAVKNSGVSYVIIRCGYRGYGSGALVVDPYFEQNIKGATAAGIKVGVYFFSQAVNKNEAVEEASMVLQLVRGYTISYPIFLDVEYSGAAGNTGRADKLDVATRTEIIKAFCETIRNSGYTAGVYANKSWLTSMIDTSQLSKYKIWLAQYAAAPTYTGRYDMWQYKSTGRVTGINGDVDLNLSYLGY
ncbi:MAG: Ig-like domain-containing protein [Lachnospiraceae bacterium]|nr:Ig-like domain-containing protein [Lachnospiraceae bacterium]